MEAIAVVKAVCLALGLSAACGFRTFLPLLALSVVARLRLFDFALSDSLSWIGSDAALLTLAVAALVEFAGDKIPFVDNLLSLVSTVTRPVAGMLAAGAAVSTHDPVVAGIAALIVGLPTAAAVHTVSATSRVASTVQTGGLANPILSTIEDVVSAAMVALAFLAPVLAALLLVAFGVAAYRMIRGLGRRLPGLGRAVKGHVLKGRSYRSLKADASGPPP